MGHSEGGLVAPVVAGASDAVDFVVLLAGPAVSGREVLRFQLSRGVEGAPVSQAARDAVDAATAAMLDVLAAGGTAPEAAAAYRSGTAGLAAADRTALGLDAANPDALAAGLATPWMRYFLGYDPVPALRALRVPALAVFGGRDQQVRAADNVPAAVDALAGAPQGSAVLVLPGLNHLFQPTADRRPGRVRPHQHVVRAGRAPRRLRLGAPARAVAPAPAVKRNAGPRPKARPRAGSTGGARPPVGA